MPEITLQGTGAWKTQKSRMRHTLDTLVRDLRVLGLVPGDVAPECRRQGIGTRLVQAVIEEARKQRIPVLYLYTTGKENERFYARMGWSVKERVDYLGKQRVIMEIGFCTG